MFINHHPPVDPDDLGQAMQLFDSDESGLISKREARRMLKHLGGIRTYNKDMLTKKRNKDKKRREKRREKRKRKQDKKKQKQLKKQQDSTSSESETD